VEALQSLGDALVRARPAGGAEGFIERLVDQRVGELEAPDALV